MIGEQLNLKLAYNRVCDEIVGQPKSGRAFVVNPLERELVETDLDSWLEELRSGLNDETYTPGPADVAGAPKGGGRVRPAARLALADRVAYTALVGACLKSLVETTRWSQRKIDFAPLFHARDWQGRRWILKPYLGWESWTSTSLRHFESKSTKHVVTVDVAGFFENVDLGRLAHDLKRIKAPAKPVMLLGACLNKWAATSGRGLPQGVLASDVLAKLYLESLDQRLKQEGYRHTRYVDDIRIFCRTFSEAQRALVLVTELLRERGLTVQSAKTKIRDADDDFRREIEGALPAIRDLNREFIDEAIDAGLLPADEASVPVSVIDDLVNVEPERMDPEVIRRAWQRSSLMCPSRTSRCFDIY